VGVTSVSPTQSSSSSSSPLLFVVESNEGTSSVRSTKQRLRLPELRFWRLLLEEELLFLGIQSAPQEGDAALWFFWVATGSSCSLATMR